jgi:hypothetical protein
VVETAVAPSAETAIPVSLVVLVAAVVAGSIPFFSSCLFVFLRAVFFSCTGATDKLIYLCLVGPKQILGAEVLPNDAAKTPQLAANFILQHIRQLIRQFPEITSNGADFVFVSESQLAVSITIDTVYFMHKTLAASAHDNHLSLQSEQLSNPFNRNLSQHIYVYHDHVRSRAKFGAHSDALVTPSQVQVYERSKLLLNEGAYLTDTVGMFTTSTLKNQAFERLNRALMCSQLEVHPRFFTLTAHHRAGTMLEKLLRQLTTCRKQLQKSVSLNVQGSYIFGKKVDAGQEDDLVTGLALMGMAQYHVMQTRMLQIV